MTAVAQDFEQITPSPDAPGSAVPGGCQPASGEGTFTAWKPSIAFELFEALDHAALTGDEVVATLAALTLAKPKTEARDVWIMKWSEDYCAQKSKRSRAVVQRAKAKLKKVGLIKRERAATKGTAATWDVTKLVMVKKGKSE